MKPFYPGIGVYLSSLAYHFGVHVRHPFASPALEQKFINVADLAIGGSFPLVTRLGPMKEAMKDSLSRIAFFRACNEGFIKAQAAVLDHLATDTPEKSMPWQEELLFRRLIDAIAWQVLGRQTYIGRQLYRDQPPHRWRDVSGRDSLLNAARAEQGDDLTRFVMIIDLSTLIQTGDLLISEPLDGRYSLIELKEGEVSREAAELLFKKGGSSSKETIESFFTRYGEKGFQQLARMYRQARRMSHVADTVNKGTSHDPDRDHNVAVPQETLELESYDSDLSDLLDRARKKQWAIDVIDECLFVGVYRTEVLIAGHRSHQSWLRRMGFHEQYPSCDLLGAMVNPLALPLFVREFNRDNVLDLLFGRAAVFMGLHPEKFAALSSELGLPMAWSSRKEAAKLPSKRIGLKVDNRVLLFGANDSKTALGGGIVEKIFFHGIRPRSAVTMLQHMAQRPDVP